MVKPAYRRAELRPNWAGEPGYVADTLQKAEYKMFEIVKPKFVREENGIRFHVAAWRMEVFATVGTGCTLRVVGFLNAEAKDGAWVPSNLAVAPEYRRKGIATTMLGLMEASFPGVKMDRVFGLLTAEAAACRNAYNNRIACRRARLTDV